MHGCLACRVGATDNINIFVFAGNGFARSRTIVHARSLQPLHARNIQAAPLHTGSDRKRVARNLTTIAQLYHAVWAVDTQPDRFLRREDLDAEPPGLRHRAPGQVAAAQAGRESK